MCTRHDTSSIRGTHAETYRSEAYSSPVSERVDIASSGEDESAGLANQFEQLILASQMLESSLPRGMLGEMSFSSSNAPSPCQYYHQGQTQKHNKNLLNRSSQHQSYHERTMKCKPMQFFRRNKNGNWHDDKSDRPHRRSMIPRILKYLQVNTSASPGLRRKLPQMVQELEISLYLSAPSMKAYCDTSTLKNRLQQLAMTLGQGRQQRQQLRKKRNHDQQREIQQHTIDLTGDSEEYRESSQPDIP
mmetsp:Transcript_39253/g.57739  ORF Transcript_39253/g.57739 Transcript_39253/m.57739 type:complete len:246 (+) Transcript_39253:55-792(+)